MFHKPSVSFAYSRRILSSAAHHPMSSLSHATLSICLYQCLFPGGAPPLASAPAPAPPPPAPPPPLLQFNLPGPLHTSDRARMKKRRHKFVRIFAVYILNATIKLLFQLPRGD